MPMPASLQHASKSAKELEQHLRRKAPVSDARLFPELEDAAFLLVWSATTATAAAAHAGSELEVHAPLSHAYTNAGPLRIALRSAKLSLDPFLVRQLEVPAGLPNRDGDHVGHAGSFSRLSLGVKSCRAVTYVVSRAVGWVRHSPFVVPTVTRRECSS